MTASTDRLIIAGQRIGSLRLDGKVDDIVKLLGPGTLRPSGGWSFSKLQTWDAVGVWVDSDPGTGNVFWIGVDTRGSNRWADYSTRDGIRFGARREDVVAAIGPPERTVTSGGSTSLYYDRRGLRLTLADIGADAGKVCEIRVVWPSVARGDNLIVPGRRISNIEVGMPVERALTLLGGGYHGGAGTNSYYWPHLGLSLVETGGHVQSVRASRGRPSDAAGIRYATTGEISLGSSVSDIRVVFGEPSRTESPRGGLQSWIYDSRGIAFILDNPQNVRGIDVFRSRGTIADFDKVIEFNPKYAPAYYNRGNAYGSKGDLDRAIADFDKAIELDPNFANAHNDRGNAYRSKGDLDRAIADFDKAIELNPNYAPAYNNRGNAYGSKGDFDSAIADYNKAIELDPKNAAAYNNRGVAYASRGDLDRAIADCSKAIELDPKNAAAYNTRAMAYFTAGKAAQGLLDVEKSLELSPDEPYAVDTRGHIFEALGRREEAIADYRRALAKAPQLQESKDALKRLGASP